MILSKLQKMISNKYLILLIGLVNITKIFLAKGGFMTEPDEGIYYKSFTVLKRISDFQFRDALHQIFASNGRPLGVVIDLIPASLQVIWAKLWHFNVFETHSMWVIFGFNFLIFLFILFYIYKITQIIFQNNILALFSVLFYSLLTNSYIYLRHVFPYDISILFFLYVMHKLLKFYIEDKEDPDIFQMLKLGIISFLGFMLYPGNFPLFLANFLLLVGFQIINPKHKKYLIFSSVFAFISGTVLIIIPVEILSCIGKNSYIYSLLNLSGTILQGDFHESAIFLFKYFLDVEGITGILWIIGLIIFIYFVPEILRSHNINFRSSALIFLVFSGLFIFYTFILSFWLHKMVVYGRIIHQFIPVFSIFSTTGYYILFRKFLKSYSSICILFMLILSLVNYYSNFVQYLRISYPKSVYWKFLRHTDPNLIQEVSEYEESWSNLPSAHYIQNEKIINTKDTIIAVNTQYFFPVEHLSKFKAYMAPENYKLILKGKHFLNFKAYQYEGYTPNARKIIRKIKPEIKIYKKKD